MKILILGANGELGNKLYNYLRKDNKNEIVTTSNRNIKYSSKFHKKINLKKNLNKLFKIISNQKFDLIINCLFIINKKNEYDTDIPEKIISYINRKNYKNIIWLEVSSYSIFLKYKTNYIRSKINFENFLKNNFRNNLSKLKIIRIGNFLNNHMTSRLNFFNTKKCQFVLSNKKNILYVTNNQIIKNFINHNLFKKKIEFNLVKKTTLEDIFILTNNNYKKIIFLNISEKIPFFLSIFLNNKYKYKIFNLLNLFYSK